MSQGSKILGLDKGTWFQVFKYSVYLLIFINVVQFFIEDYKATSHTFRDGIAWNQLTDAYATTFDSAAWLVLLLMFELETYVIPDEKMVGKTRWSINIVSAICFIFIVQAFLGYYDKYTVMGGYAASAYESACAAVGTVQSYAKDFDDYFDLTAANCAAVTGNSFFVHSENSMISSADVLQRMKNLAMTDVVNAGAWILVIIVLQIDVLLQMRRELTEKLYKINIYIKSGLYLVLFGAAVYWGYMSALLDFWDAMLWIIAFFFIELNLFQWNEETRAEDAAETVVSEASA